MTLSSQSDRPLIAVDDARGTSCASTTTMLAQSAVMAPHARASAEVLAALDVLPERGLDDAAVRARRAVCGSNVLQTHPPATTLSILLHQVTSSVVALLAVAALLSASFGDWTEAAAILVVLVINTAIGFVTELKAERSMEALRAIGSQMQRVRRAGKTLMMRAEDLVPGDILLLEAGDVATADARLTAAANLSVDESALTGESVPVEKSVDPVARNTPVADRRCMLFKGTALTRGSAIGVVTATGMATELGRVAELAANAAPEPSPLTRNLARLSTQLVALTIVIAVFVAVAGIAKGQSAFLMIEAAIALAVAAIPEGLPIVATLVLARGMWRMSESNALIERLSAVETLGATTVILTDKTGTLTENRMTVRRITTPSQDLTIETGGTPQADPIAVRLLEVATLCNDAVIDGPDQPASGDPLETALLRVARTAGIERPALLIAKPEIARRSFDSDTRLMATVHAAPEGTLVAVKGAPEAVLPLAIRIAGPDGPYLMTEELRAEWRQRTEDMGRSGLRVLAFAERSSSGAEDEPYCDLTFLGLIGLHDPPRREVPAAIASCRQAGIRVVMVTGDHAVTAASIGSEIGITRDAPRVIEGRTLGGEGGMDVRRILEADVFARVSPAQKLELVAVYQSAGEVVAMTGDGVNDAPALKKADIGVAMGLRGTEVARQAAAMILRDDSFATIVTAIREGRVIFANIRRFVMYLLACNLGEVMVVGVAVSSGMPLPLYPLQILYLNLVTDVFPAFALAMSEGDEDVLRRPPRNPSEPLIGRSQWIEIALFGAVMTAATLAAMHLTTSWLKLDQSSAITASFLTLALAQLWHVFNMAGTNAGLVRNEVTRNPYVWAAIAICLVLLVAACHVPAMAAVLHLAEPDTRLWTLVAVMSLASMLVGRAVVGAVSPWSLRTQPATLT